MLATLGGSCTVPVGAFAEAIDAAATRRCGCRASWPAGTGARVIRLTRRGDDPEALGAALARALLEGGGAAIDGFDTARDPCSGDAAP